MRSRAVAPAVVLALLVTATAAAFWREAGAPWDAYGQPGARETAVDVVPGGVVGLDVAATGERELCLTCHAGIEEMSRSHPLELGCVVCHGGQPLALDKDVAHQGLAGGANPSALDVVERGCGAAGLGGDRCHGGGELQRDHVARVMRSLQATYAGGTGTVLQTFSGFETPTGVAAQVRDARARGGLDELAGLDAVASGPPPAGQTARDLKSSCIDGGCHLWSGGGGVEGSEAHAAGCAACHVRTDGSGQYQGSDEAAAGLEIAGGGRHELTTAIPFTQCDTCHNRGIYDLRGLVFHVRDDVTPAEMYSGSERSYYRPGERYARCEVTLACIDCHAQAEVMGDGRLLPGKAAAVRTRCSTCHGTPDLGPRLHTVSANDTTLLALGRASGVYDVAAGDRLATSGGEYVLSSARWTDDGLTVVDKVDGARHPVPLVRDSACEQDGSSQRADYCHTCHYQEQP